MYWGLDGVLEYRVTVNLSEVPVFIKKTGSHRNLPERFQSRIQSRNAAPGAADVQLLRFGRRGGVHLSTEKQSNPVWSFHVRRTHSIDHQARRGRQERHWSDHRKL